MKCFWKAAESSKTIEKTQKLVETLTAKQLRNVFTRVSELSKEYKCWQSVIWSLQQVQSNSVKSPSHLWWCKQSRGQQENSCQMSQKPDWVSQTGGSQQCTAVYDHVRSSSRVFKWMQKATQGSEWRSVMSDRLSTSHRPPWIHKAHQQTQFNVQSVLV